MSEKTAPVSRGLYGAEKEGAQRDERRGFPRILDTPQDAVDELLHLEGQLLVAKQQPQGAPGGPVAPEGTAAPVERAAPVNGLPGVVAGNQARASVGS